MYIRMFKKKSCVNNTLVAIKKNELIKKKNIWN